MLFIRYTSKAKVLKNILCKVTGKTNEANPSLRITEYWILLLFGSTKLWLLWHYKDELKVKKKLLAERYFIIIAIQIKGVIKD